MKLGRPGCCCCVGRSNTFVCLFIYLLLSDLLFGCYVFLFLFFELSMVSVRLQLGRGLVRALLLALNRPIVRYPGLIRIAVFLSERFCVARQRQRKQFARVSGRLAARIDRSDCCADRARLPDVCRRSSVGRYRKPTVCSAIHVRHHHQQ